MRFLHTAYLSLDGPTWPTQNCFKLIETREDIVDLGACCLGIIDSDWTGDRICARRIYFALFGAKMMCVVNR